MQPGRWLAVDSDGSVIDSMSSKHRLAFAPALQAVYGASDDEARGFVDLNLRSPLRGANRFVALAAFLAARGEAGTAFLAWATGEGPHAAPALRLLAARGDPDGSLARALAYSREVDVRVAALPPPRPFGPAPSTLASLARDAAVAVVSSAPTATLRAEWRHAGLDRLVAHWGGQEEGSKAAQLARLAGAVGPGRVLMVGDAPADREAAAEAGVPFHPLPPGDEPAAWDRLRDHVGPAWVSGRYDRASPEHAAAESAFLRSLALHPCPPPLPCP